MRGGGKRIVPGETKRLRHEKLLFLLIPISPIANIEMNTKRVREEPAFREPEGFYFGILVMMRKGQVDESLRLPEIKLFSSRERDQIPSLK